MAKMFKTKRDVDRHVNNLINKLKDEKEKSSRGYQFARLYYDVGEYDTAKTYLMTFLNVRETVHQAHNLLGQIYEATGEKHKALDCYKRSLLIDESQKDIILKVCELSCSLDLDTEASKSWLEKAQKLFPSHPSVFKLKEKLMETESNGDISGLERLILAELQANPEDVKLHIKLLRLYIKGREIDKAFDHATGTEKARTFARSLEWYECVTDVYKVYQDQHNCTGNTRFYTQKLWALSSLVHLRLVNSSRDMVNCSKALHQLDVALLEALKGCSKQTGAEWEEVLDEMQGQFFFHTANFLLKRAQKDQMSWKDACSFVSVCYLISANFPAVNPKASWYIQLPRDRREFYEQLMKVGNYRLSQGGHMLRGLCQHQEGGLWARRLQQQLCNVRSKDALYSIIFSQPVIRNAKDSSYLVQTDVFTTTSLEVPSTTLLASYDQESYKLFPDDLNQLVWLALQHYSVRDDTQPDYGFQIFQKLKFSKPDFKNSDPGSLSQLDTLVFFYATVKWVAMQQEQLKQTIYPIIDKPDLLPACISPPMCTKDQCDWWSAVYKMDTNTASQLDRIWGTVIRGLQTIRMIPPHRLPINILFHVAHTLEERAKSIEAYSEEGHLQDTRLQAVLARAALYWRETMSILEKLERDDYVLMPKESLFPDNSVPDTAQLQRMIEQTKFALAMVAMREGKYEEAVKGFDSASSPWASYHTAKIYTQLAAQCSSGNNNGNASHDDCNFQMLALLNKARNALYITQERIGQDKQHELYSVVSQEMDDVESRIMRAESGDTLVDSLVSLATSNYSTAESDVGSELDRQSPSDQEPATLASLQSSRDMSLLNAVENHSLRLKPSPVRFDIELKSLERRMIKFEEVFTKSNERFLDILEDMKTALKECTGVNKSIWEMMQAQKSIPPAPPRDVGTIPQHPAPPHTHQQMMMGPGCPPHPASQQSYGTQSNASYMSQYGHPFSGYYGPHRGIQPPVGFGSSTQSQRGMHHQLPEEDDMYYVDGEYYEDHGNDLQDNYQTPDSALVQDWPFGHKAGLEGKSTITYYPSGRGGQQSSSGYFANAYRGQSLQYGYQQQVSPGPAMPGPGYFSRPSTVPQPITSQIQITKQSPNVLMSTFGQTTAGNPGMAATSEPSAPASSASAPNATMPPNAVAGPSLLVKPKLIPTSLGVPVPKTTSQQQEPPKTTSVFASVAQVAATQQSDSFKQSSVTGSGNIPTFIQQMSGGQGQASSLLSAIAAKHEQQQSQQDSKQVQGSAASMSHVPQKPAETSITKDQTPSKTMFGGLVFTSTPVVAEKKAEIERPKASPVSKTPAVTTSAVNPFAGFSLTPSRPSTSQPTTVSNKSVGGAGDAKVSESQVSNTSYILGQGSPSATLSFGSALIQDPNAFRAKENFTGFKGAGQKLFGSASPDKNDKSPIVKGGHSLTTGHDEEPVEEYEPNVDFKPIVPLPDLVEVKTGEEDEEKLFGERAKLFRFDKESNQWKERGIGEIKILRHKVSQRVRILMRREQVLKLCANHHITKDMKLTQMPTSDRAWCWIASDYAEEEMKLEKFAVKLKTVESAESFRKIFEACQEALSHTGQDESSSRNQDQRTESKQDAKTGGKLSDIFKVKVGSWKCNGCLINNDESILKCPCCNTYKPGVKEETSHIGKDELSSRNQGQGIAKETESEQNAKTGGKLSDIFKLKAGSWKCNGCLIVNDENVLKCPCCNTYKPGVKPEEIKDTKKPAETFSVRASESGFNLPQTTQAQPNTQFKFGMASTETFKFGDTGSSLSAPTTQSAEFKFGNTTKPVISLGGQTSDVTKADTPVRTEKKEIDAKESEVKTGQKDGSLSAIFQNKPGMWKCDGCLVNNGPETNKCPCCGSLKSGVKENPGKVESFGAQTSGSGLSISGKADTSKFTFGGNQSTFTFGTPISGQQGRSHESENKFEMSASKPSPFTFGTSTTVSTSTPAKSEGFKFTLPVSFGTSKTESNSTSTENPFKFTFSMTPGSKSPGVASPKSPEDSFYVNSEGDDSHIYFEPIVQLPEKVDLKTGEEDEDVLFEHKAKLFRFTDGQWKERGIGIIKILLNKTIQKARVLMRREHVHKICCNHYITRELDLKPMPQSKGKAWIWFAMDFTDGDPKPEQLCVKFMQPETATKFKETFDETRRAVNLLQSKPSPISTRMISNDNSINDDVAFVSEEVASPEEVKKARSFLLPDNFYLYKRCPPCPGCPGCENYIPPQKPAASSQEESRISSTGASDTFIEKISAAKEDGKEDNAGKDDTGEGPYLGLFSGSTAGGISFASLAAKSGDSGYVFGRQSEGKPFHFTGAGQKLFGGLMAEKGDEEENEEGDEEVDQGEDIHFEPLVPLPALIEVKTGEEDDDVLFNARAKLFRYEKDVSQWKERGIGEMKILKNKISGTYRLLLRREQVFKLACNHRLTSDLNLKPMKTSETSFCWTAYDFSEEDGKIEQFAVKFKNIEIAREFKSKVDSCQVELRAMEDAKATADIESDKDPNC